MFYIWNSLGTKFQPKLPSLSFWTKVIRKSVFLNQKNLTITIESYTVELVSVLNFTFNERFWFLEQISQKQYFHSKAEKNEYHHWILHIQINPSAKFQIKIDNFDFLDQICPKMVFPV